MATIFSSFYNADNLNQTEFGQNSRSRAIGTMAGVKFGSPSVRLTNNSGLIAGDAIRMAEMHSSTRIKSIVFNSAGTPTAGGVNVGIYKSGTSHDGPVVDADLFASSLAMSDVHNATDAFSEANLTVRDSGKPLWMLAGLSEDPNENWEIAITVIVPIITPSEAEVSLGIEFMGDI